MNAARQVGFVLIVSLLAVLPAAAQGRGGPGRGLPQRGGQPRREALLQNINQTFINRVTRVMALSDDQVPRFQRVVLLWAQRRAGFEDDERQLRQALTGQLRPGIAANGDSVARVVDALNANRVAYAETFRDEMRELTPILTPVQRGQFQVARDQMLQTIRNLQQQRAAAGFPVASPEP